MPELPTVKAVEVIRALERAGFYRIRQRGSHAQMKKGHLLVTVPIHSGDLRRATLRSILRQARLKEDELLAFL